MKRLKVLLTMAMLLLLSACGNDETVYHQYRTVPTQGWEREDTLSFVLPDSIFTRHPYRLEIELRHTENYAYRNLWIAVVRPHSTPPICDTLCLELADTEGKWYGEGNSSTFYQFHAPAGDIVFSHADTLIQLIHLMTPPRLKGISDVGIRLSLTGSVNTQKDK